MPVIYIRPVAGVYEWFSTLSKKEQVLWDLDHVKWSPTTVTYLSGLYVFPLPFRQNLEKMPDFIGIKNCQISKRCLSGQKFPSQFQSCIPISFGRSVLARLIKFVGRDDSRSFQLLADPQFYGSTYIYIYGRSLCILILVSIVLLNPMLEQSARNEVESLRADTPQVLHQRWRGAIS